MAAKPIPEGYHTVTPYLGMPEEITDRGRDAMAEMSVEG
jgi:hypothetical protein